MTYFSRLTDIVTCNLQDILARESDPHAAVAQLIREIEEGVAGAKRSVNTATASEQRLTAEMSEHQTQIAFWTAKAREELLQGREQEARQALSRKKELDDLIAALQQQRAAAGTTREHLATTLRALEARLAEARRRQEELQELAPPAGTQSLQGTDTSVGNTTGAPARPASLDQARAAQIEAELEALRRELGNAGPA
ncbi:MAG TPA: PspA/IM30 family protein [Planctomycetaceae bacterium]|nr:PspA/IM30 family protein [Planctomycetaceae bacterium]